MKTIGYFDGTDSALLTKLAANGFCTMPLGNEWDGHGKIATHIEPGEVDIIIAYLHKLLHPKDEESRPIPTPVNLLYRAKTYNIPVYVVVQKELQKKAKKLLKEAAPSVQLVTPEDLDAEVCKKLGC
ncbi:MAG: hypothetical protein PVJ05_12845 [Candidatus Thorarchaeota archaeon]|jgi:hypothetical protein